MRLSRSKTEDRLGRRRRRDKEKAPKNGALNIGRRAEKMNTKLKKTIGALAACACLVLFMSAGCGAKTVAVKRKGTTAAVVRRNEKVILTAPKTAEKGKLRWYEKKKGVWKLVGRGCRLTRRFGKYGRFRLKCVRRSGGKKRTAKIEIAVIAGKLTVAEQPRNAVVRDGGTAVFEISLSERNPNAAYQWQKKTGGSFVDVKGATSPSVPPVAGHRCAVCG